MYAASCCIQSFAVRNILYEKHSLMQNPCQGVAEARKEPASAAIPRASKTRIQQEVAPGHAPRTPWKTWCAAGARACYGLGPMTETAWWRKRQAKATKCSPATVSGSRS